MPYFGPNLHSLAVSSTSTDLRCDNFSQPSFCRRQKDQLGISSHGLKNEDCIVNTNSGVAPSLRFFATIINVICVHACMHMGKLLYYDIIITIL